MKKILALSLALIMLVGLLPATVSTVTAVETDAYLDLSGATAVDTNGNNSFVVNNKYTASLVDSPARSQTYEALNLTGIFTSAENVDEHVTQTITINKLPQWKYAKAPAAGNLFWAAGYFNTLSRNYGTSALAEDKTDFLLYSINGWNSGIYLSIFNPAPGATKAREDILVTDKVTKGVPFELTTVWHSDNSVTFYIDGVSLGKYTGFTYAYNTSPEYENYLSIGYSSFGNHDGKSQEVDLSVSDIQISHGHAENDDHNCTTANNCSLCGAEVTPAKAEHAFTVPQKDAAQHWSKCENCDVTTTKENHSFVAENAVETALKTPADCDSNAVYYKSCACGLVSTADTDTFEAAQTATGNHTDVDGDWESNDTDHWHTCECGEELDKAGHTGGTPSCTAKPTCDTCGASYGTTLDHTYNVPQKDATHHWNKCATCDATDTKVAHTFDKKVKNETTLKAAATCVEDAVYYYSCACGQVSTSETFEDPDTAVGQHVDADNKWESDATDHWHTCGCGEKFEKVAHAYDQKVKNESTLKTAANCDDDAVYYLSCVCGKVSTTETFVDTGSAKGHSHGTEWKSDKDNHWHECACGDKADSAKHTEKLVDAKDATETEKGYTGDKVCSVCGKEIAKGQEIPVLEPAPTEPAPTTPPATEPAPTTPPVNPETGDNGTAVYALLLAVSMLAMVALMIPDIRSKLIRK